MFKVLVTTVSQNFQAVHTVIIDYDDLAKAREAVNRINDQGVTADYRQSALMLNPRG